MSDTPSYEAVFEHVADGLLVHDAETGEIVDSNRTAHEMTGYAAADLRDRTLAELSADASEHAESAERRFQRAVAEGSAQFEWRLETAQGETLPVEINLRVFDSDGDDYLLASLRDVSERVAYEERLADQNQRLRTLVENLPVILFALDDDGTFTLSEGRGLESLGLSPGEVVGESVFDVYDDSPAIRENVRAALDGDPRRVTADVGDRVFETWYQPVVDDGTVSRVVGVAIDTTERVRKEREIERTNEQLEAERRYRKRIMDAIPDIYYILDAQGEPVEFNQSAVEATGYSRAELESMSATDFFSAEDAARVAGGLREALETGSTTIEVTLHTANGETVPYEFRSTSLESPDGDPVVAGIARDISARKRRETRLERQNEQLRVLNRIVRHDIRNDMAVVIGWGGELAEHVDSEGREMLDLVVDTSQHVVDLTRTVRDFVDAIGTGDDPELEPVDLASIVRDELEKRASTYPSAEFTVRGSLPRVDVTANELLSSVFRNLLNNAVQHNDGDVPHVAVSAEERPDSVVVSVADDGPGVPEERRDAIFGRGEQGLDDPAAGVGLSLVDTLVDGYGGAVWVEDNVPEGSVFVVRLPKAECDEASET